MDNKKKDNPCPQIRAITNKYNRSFVFLVLYPQGLIHNRSSRLLTKRAFHILFF